MLMRDRLQPLLEGPTEKSDDVRTTDSVKTLTVSSVEELDTRSMSLSACPCDLLVTVGSHEQQSISRRAPPPGRHFWSRARMGLWSGVRARFDDAKASHSPVKGPKEATPRRPILPLPIAQLSVKGSEEATPRHPRRRRQGVP